MHAKFLFSNFFCVNIVAPGIFYIHFIIEARFELKKKQYICAFFKKNRLENIDTLELGKNRRRIIEY
jgi:hypothetical protein